MMTFNFDDEKPIYIQLAEGIEDAVLSGAFPEETQIPSTTEISVGYKINPATALKGVNLLVETGILYKKRGVGMFVASGAAEKIREKRKQAFFDAYVKALVQEAQKLKITKEDVIGMIEKGFLR
ncbi:MAG: putative transcriptional regulator [Oscillospiraceae bacterium]|jgi:DNA-binding transcriptional regulator YhcF (GntR family)|nr:putative transcriptional regulator [Oscillospiraceae bacterium]